MLDIFFSRLQPMVKKEDEVVVKKEIKEEIDDLPEEKKKDKKMKKEKKENKKTKKSKQSAGPMHFTANNEPRALDVLGDLDPSIFNEVGIIPCMLLICARKCLVIYLMSLSSYYSARKR